MSRRGRPPKWCWDVPKLKRMYEAGEKVIDIQREFGVSYNTVDWWMNYYKVREGLGDGNSTGQLVANDPTAGR